MKRINRYIEYEIEINSLPLRAFGVSVGGNDAGKDQDSNTEDGYHVATEDDIDILARFLSGGL
jgi:hypothetical protein